MSDIQTYLEELRTAIYGEEVRSAIINAINQCYQDAADGVKPELTFDTLENGTRINVSVGGETSTFTVTNGSTTILATRQVSSSSINCAAGADGYVDIPVTFPGNGYTFVSVVQTWANGGTLYTNSNTTELTDGGNVRVYWANWSSSSLTVTLTVSVLFSYTIQSESGGSIILNNTYPVGSVYISTNNINPSQLFGGTWRAIGQGRTLVGVGSIEANTVTNRGSVTAGSFNPALNERGGELTHTLTANEMPTHNHYTSETQKSMNFSSGEGYTIAVANTYGDTHNYYTGRTGGGAAHNNVQPYLAVYIWERTA